MTRTAAAGWSADAELASGWWAGAVLPYAGLRGNCYVMEEEIRRRSGTVSQAANLDPRLTVRSRQGSSSYSWPGSSYSWPAALHGQELDQLGNSLEELGRAVKRCHPWSHCARPQLSGVHCPVGRQEMEARTVLKTGLGSVD